MFELFPGQHCIQYMQVQYIQSQVKYADRFNQLTSRKRECVYLDKTLSIDGFELSQRIIKCIVVNFIRVHV